MVKGMGGAMDLVHGARKVVVLMEHTTREGASKLVAHCDLPLTGIGVVHRVITDLGVFDIGGDAFVLVELSPGVSEADARRVTAAPLRR
jgi:3-oxoacid CoA-transferase subunit B